MAIYDRIPADAKRELAWFLGLTFGLSWLFWLVPLTYYGSPITRQSIRSVGQIGATLMPGLAAVITTRWIARRELRALNLGRLGPKRFYLWALLLPYALVLVALCIALSLGAASLDMMRVRGLLFPEAYLGAGIVSMLGVLGAILLSPFISAALNLGGELGWRGYLLPVLLPLGKWRAILLSSAAWGLWHAPLILQARPHFESPLLNLLLTMGFYLFVGAILSWLYLETKSPWTPAVALGVIVEAERLAILFLEPRALSVERGLLASPVGWIGMALFIAWLIYTRRLPRTLDE